MHVCVSAVIPLCSNGVVEESRWLLSPKKIYSQKQLRSHCWPLTAFKYLEIVAQKYSISIALAFITVALYFNERIPFVNYAAFANQSVYSLNPLIAILKKSFSSLERLHPYHSTTKEQGKV